MVTRHGIVSRAADPAGALPVLARAMNTYSDIKVLYAASAYAGRCAQTVLHLYGVQVQGGAIQRTKTSGVGYPRSKKID